MAIVNAGWRSGQLDSDHSALSKFAVCGSYYNTECTTHLKLLKNFYTVQKKLRIIFGKIIL